MKRLILSYFYLVCVSFTFGFNADAEGGMWLHQPKPIVTVGTLPVIKLDHNMTATPAEVSEIKQHIANLKKIDHPDFAFSSDMSGNDFAPIASSAKFEGGILMEHGLKTSGDLQALVAFGPKALPFLLAALSDDTPTTLTMKQPFQYMGGMFFSDESDANPANTNEQKTVDALPERGDFGETTESYTLKIGDICFAIVGEIVGRNYLAARYQMTACAVINSPIHDPELAKQVRTVWSSTNAAQPLLDSLLLDYSAKFNNGKVFGVQMIDRRLQPGAAMRLLYYFPQESAGMIAARLDGLDVNGCGNNVTNQFRRDTLNEVEAEDFINAVSWSDSFLVRKAILNIFKKTTDPKILLAALPGIYPNMNDLARVRLEYFIDHLPPVERGPYGDGYYLLVALGQRFGEQAKPTFIRYLQNASPQRLQTMQLVLQETQPQWAAELLGQHRSHE
jgi:hypothetical protein